MGLAPAAEAAEATLLLKRIEFRRGTPELVDGRFRGHDDLADCEAALPVLQQRLAALRHPNLRVEAHCEKVSQPSDTQETASVRNRFRSMGLGALVAPPAGEHLSVLELRLWIDQPEVLRGRKIGFRDDPKATREECEAHARHLDELNSAESLAMLTIGGQCVRRGRKFQLEASLDFTGETQKVASVPMLGPVSYLVGAVPEVIPPATGEARAPAGRALSRRFERSGRAPAIDPDSIRVEPLPGAASSSGP
jgi:hypothetical protein